MTERDLEQRITEVEDRLEIIQLLNTYAVSVDQADEETYMGLWDEDAVIDLGVYGQAKGKEAIKENIQGTWAAFKNTNHHIGNIIIKEYSGDTAQATCNVFSTSFTNEDVLTTTYATYKDQLAKKDGKWLIVKRILEISYSGPAEDVWGLVSKY